MDRIYNLTANLAANCIPEELHEMGLDRYHEFLSARPNSWRRS